MQVESSAQVAEQLAATGYLCDESLATVVFLAERMQRPLLLEGEPGTGKTALAEALAQVAVEDDAGLRRPDLGLADTVLDDREAGADAALLG
ncbi:MAG: hypothetical protein ACPF9W_08870, partial [Nocardioides sp.]